LKWIVGFYGLQIAVLIVLIMISWFIWDKRFRKKHGRDVPEGFVRTNEINIDPTTKKKLIVYYHPETGERFYKEED
jgi:heme/copper-type cytochrome/quinol oxidase subunit 2